MRLRVVRKRGFRKPISTIKATVRTTCGSRNRKLPRAFNRPRPRNLPGMEASVKEEKSMIDLLRLPDR